MFAEGTTSNGRALLPFRRGAFEAMRTVVPVVIKLPERYMMPTYCNVEFWPQAFMFFASFCFLCMEIQILPEFTPTEWMLENHKDKGDLDWKIYSQCVRLAMAKQSNLHVSNRQIRELLSYEKFMQGKSNEVTVDGKTFVYSKKGSNESNDDNYQSIKSDIEASQKTSI